jgi:FkbM family methyltransferase
VYVFGRASGQGINGVILSAALHAKGYNNFESLRVSGEEHFIKLLATHNPRLCIDVGASTGSYTESLLRHTSADIVAFEPLPDAFSTLSRLEYQFPGRLISVNKGVGEENGVLSLHFGAGDSEFASFSDEVSEIAYVGASNTRTLDVDVITLDSFIADTYSDAPPEIDLIKIDTEGFEFEVLRGARETLRQTRPKFIQIEFNWHQLFRAHSLLSLSRFLPGYQAYQILPYGKPLSFRDVALPESNIFRFSNFVFVREDISATIS